MRFKITKIELYVFIGFGILLFIIPYLFTRSWGILPIEDVGGTVGGVTAPFLSFFGSILVYLALKSQVKANSLVQKQFRKQEKAEFYSNKVRLANEKIILLKDEINSFFYLHRDDDKVGGPFSFEYRGSQAIYILLARNVSTFYGKDKRNSFELEPKFTELYKLLKLFIQTITMISEEEFDSKQENDKAVKDNLMFVLNYLYDSKIKWNFRSMEKNKSKHEPHCDGNCGINHGLPVELFEPVYIIESLLGNNKN